MRRCYFIAVYTCLLVCWLANSASAQIPKAGDAPLPKLPEASRALVQLPPGYRLELIAAEPLIREPSGVCWDERGRLFVCELHGYNLDGHYDIEELNKSGRLDREVRRVQATDEAKTKAEAETTGTVKRLIDSDGDGRMDRAEVWADNLPPCYGMVAARGGLIVVCSPRIVFLADRDGDGKAEIRETLFEGFPEGVLERRLNAPQWGLDGWIYLGSGQGGTKITGPNLKTPVTTPRTDLRMKPDGSAIEPVSGTTWGLGFAFTETDDRLVSSIGWPSTFIAPLPWRYLARNPYAPSPPLNDANPADRRAYPISRPHPWRTKRSDDPGFSKFYTDRYGIAESAPNGYFTSCCAPLVYQDSALPGLRGHLLACEPAQNLITRMRLDRDGSRLLMRRVPGEERSEFLASTDPWFHPIALAHAPDGTIVIADFYREIIEDYSAIPRYLQQQYNLIAGRDHGRLWRLTADGLNGKSAPSSPSFDMSDLSVARLAEEIASPRHWRRQTARRLLIERGDPSAAPRLAETARESREVAVVLNALYALKGLAKLQPTNVIAALGSFDAGVRVHALRLAEPWFDREDAVRRAVFKLADDPDARVRLQLALSLGESRGPDVAPTLARLAVESRGEPWLAAAIASSATDRANIIADELIKRRSPQGELPEFALEMLDAIARMIGAQRDDERVGALLATAAALSDDARPSAVPIQERLLAGLAQGLRGASPSPLRSGLGHRALGRLLASANSRVSNIALQTAGLLRLRESPSMKAAWEAALAAAFDDAKPIADRRSAVAILSVAPLEQASRLGRLLNVRQPAELQLAVVRALESATGPGVVDVLLADFAKLSPDVRSAIIDAVCSRQDRLPRLLDRLESGAIAAADLPAIRRVQLLEHSNASLRAKAAKLLASASTTSADRRSLLSRYQAALAGPRDPAAGQRVFEAACSKCHQLGEKGFAVGPDLDSVRTRPDESLLLDILDPSGVINPKFRAYTIVTANGRVANGLLAGESATSVTLRRERDEAETILRKEIEEMAASSKSLMPDGIEKDVSPRQIADLLAFLRQSLGPPLDAAKVLFDDEPAFLDALKDGGGTATLIADDPRSGAAALRMTPLQRSSPRIAGWNYRIVESPKASPPGEAEQFRYLRFAWKSQGRNGSNAGVMFELAASGAWPPADQPIRRYYSGKNSTPWAAVPVSPDLPADWTTVTIDLWKDCGEFTLTGIAPTAMEAPALFDRIELLRTLDAP